MSYIIYYQYDGSIINYSNQSQSHDGLTENRLVLITTGQFYQVIWFKGPILSVVLRCMPISDFWMKHQLKLWFQRVHCKISVVVETSNIKCCWFIKTDAAVNIYLAPR